MARPSLYSDKQLHKGSLILKGITMKPSNTVTHDVHSQKESVITSQKIRVLLIITGLANGGATNVVLDIANYLNDHPDFEVELLTGPIPDGRHDVTHLAYEKNIKTTVVPNLVNSINPRLNLMAWLDIRRIMAQGDYDIIHTHSSVAGIVGRLAAVAAGIPVIVHHVHGWGFHQGMAGWIRALYLNSERFCTLFTSRMIAVSRPDIQKGLSYRIGNKDKFKLIYNGIELEKFQQPVDELYMRSELGVDPDSKLVGMIGRLDEQKNPLDFIKVASRVTQEYENVQFLIVGDGPLRPECEQLIRDRKLEGKVLLLGYRNDVHKIIPILTLTAMTSLWEGLPIAFLEAMSAGKPIIANDVDGASDVVIDGETGFLVTPHQPEEMAVRILTVLYDEMLCSNLGQIAKNRSASFSIKRMLEQVESLYKELHFAAQVTK